MLKRIQQDNDNGVLGLSFWTFIFKKERFEFSNYKKISNFPQKCSCQNVPAKCVFENFPAKRFLKVPAKCFLKKFPPNSFWKVPAQK